MIDVQHQAILCVSENIQRLRTIEGLLGDNFGRKYVIEIAESSLEVLDIIATLSDIGIQTCALIADYRISDMAGLELTHMINRRYDNIKTMLMTEEADINFAQKLVNQNNVYALIKLPMNENHFIQIVGNACNQYETDAKLTDTIRRLRISEKEKSMILDSISEAIIYADTDRHVLWKNTVADKQLAMEDDNVMDSGLMQVVYSHVDFKSILNDGNAFRSEITYEDRYYALRCFPVYDRDRLPAGMVITMQDNTEKHRALDMNASLLEMSRFINNGDAMVLIYNKAFHLIDKYFDVKLMCMTGEDFDSDYVEFYGEGFTHMEQATIEALIKSVKKIIKRNAHEELVVLRNGLGTVLGYPMHQKVLLLVIDGQLSEGNDGIKYLNIIAEHIKMGIMKTDNYRRLMYQANHDGLTGLFSRAYFIKRLENHLNNHRKHQNDPGFYSLAVMDLNYFKDVNDNLSHLVGDEVLLEIAQRLRKASREGDVVARIGGDEFAVLFQTGNKMEILGLIQRLQKEVSRPIEVEEIGIRIGSSFGIVYDISSYTSVEQLLSDGDQAMYEAKKDKKDGGTAVFFEKNIQNRVERYNNIEAQLRKADIDKEMTLDYQPIIRLKDRKVMGYEGLLRWRREGRDVFAPEEFLRIAEDTGNLSDIGDRVVDMAFNDLERLGNNGDKGQFIAINLTSSQVTNDAHIHRIKEEITSRGISDNRLHVDINDRFKASQMDRMARNIGDLRDFGVRVDLDDFGRGEASLNTISRIGVDELKIDRATVNNFRLDDEAKTMVTSIISIAKSLGLKVIAEGVEKAEDAEALKALGCDYAQGYYFMKPGSLDEAMAFSNMSNNVKTGA